MKKKLLWLLIAVPIAALFITPGCENDNDSEPTGGPLTIEPHSVTAYQAGVVFQAVGGNPPFMWSVADPALGTIRYMRGRAAGYTRTSEAGVNLVQVTDDEQWSATATVIQPSETNDRTTNISAVIDLPGQPGM